MAWNVGGAELNQSGYEPLNLENKLHVSTEF